MASKNNVIEEIQELIQKIKNEYEEEVDFHFLTWDEIHEAGVGIVKILSPRLRQYFRERFNFPTGVDDWLDYYKESKNGAYFYRTSKGGKYEYFWWHEVQKVHDERNTDKNPKKCSVCKQTTFKKDGRMKLWNGEVKVIGYSQVWKPSPLAYLHPECAKKYFVDKGQPNENNIRIKEKLLRNLDKLCLDPDGYLANNEYLKTGEAEEEYQKTFNLPYQREWKNRYLKIIIDGEEIDLYDFDNASNEYFEVKRELVKKIKSEIQQNPSEWKIEHGKNENYVNKSLNQLVKHQPSGRQYWKLAINH